MNINNSILSLAAVRNSWNSAKRTTSFTCIPSHLIIIFVIEGIQSGKEPMKDDAVTKTIEDLDTRGIGWFQSESNEGDFSWVLR